MHPQYYEPGMGSWLSSFKNKAIGWAIGKGNTPGTKNTRELGYEPAEVAKAVVANIQNAPPVTQSNQQAQMLLLGGAAAALVVILLGGKRGR